MKKKQPQPAPAPPQPKAAAPAKKAAPPQATPAPKPAGEDKDTPAATTPTPGDQGKDFSEVPVQSADKKPDEKPTDTPLAAPQLTPGGGAGGGPLQLTPPRITVPADPIDWFAMRKPFTDRGLSLTARDGDQIQQNWTMTYRNMVPIFGPELSVKIANLGTPIAYDFALARDNPTQIEKFDMETEKMLPPGKKLGKVIVPIITPDTLSWTVEKLTGKKVEFRF